MPTRRGIGGAARRRRHRRMPAGAPAAVRRDGRGLRRASLLGARARRGSGLLSIGEEDGKGNELTREALPAAEGGAAQLRRQRRGPRHLLGRGRRHRVRRIHRQRRAQAERGGGRDGRGAAGRGAVRARSRARWATCCRGGPSAGSASAWTTRSTAARRCSASPAWCMVVPRAIVGEGDPQRGRAGRAAGRRRRAAAGCRSEIAGATGRTRSDRVPLPGAGRRRPSAWAAALADSFPVCRATFEEADRALGEPLSAIIFDGPAERLTLTENTQPAILTTSVAAWRLLEQRGRARRPSSPATASASTPRTSRPARFDVRRRGAHSSATAAATCRTAVPVGDGRDGGDPRPRRGRGACRRARRPPEGEVVSPANLNAPGQMVIAGHAAAVARAGERAKAPRRQAGDSPAGERAVPLRADAPAGERLAPELRAASGPRSARAGGRQRRRRAQARRRCGHRRADPPGVGAGALGGLRAPAGRRGRRPPTSRSGPGTVLSGPGPEDSHATRPSSTSTSRPGWQRSRPSPACDGPHPSEHS